MSILYRSLHSQQMGQLENGNRVKLRSSDVARVLLLAGGPLKDPIANWGPFVINTREEIKQAVEDYRQGRLV